MAAEAKHRHAIVAAAANLFRQRGYAATGMNDIVANSGAPKGSIYHYFPDGKAQVGAEALMFAGEHLRARMQALADAADDPAAFLRGIVANSAAILRDSDYRKGCTVAGVVVDTPPSETRMLEAADRTLGMWREMIGQVCQRAGMPAERAAFVGCVAISAFEGALIQARAARDIGPMNAAGEALAMIVAAELARAGVELPE